MFPFTEYGPIQLYLDHGYAYVAMDLPGTGRSDGTWDPVSRDEGEAIHDMIEFVATLDRCNGNIGMSHYCWSQWNAARTRPPHLKTIVACQVTPSRCAGRVNATAASSDDNRGGRALNRNSRSGVGDVGLVRVRPDHAGRGVRQSGCDEHHRRVGMGGVQLVQRGADQPDVVRSVICSSSTLITNPPPPPSWPSRSLWSSRSDAPSRASAAANDSGYSHDADTDPEVAVEVSAGSRVIEPPNPANDTDAALQLLDTRRRHYTVLLEDLGPDRDLVEIQSADEQHFAPAWTLWRALMSLDHIGPTTASKLMARKRPRLIPIYDDVINRHLLGGTGRLWVPLHRALQADERALHHRLLTLREAAGLDQSVSAIRVLDVLTWMDGKGYAARFANPNAQA